MGYLIDTCVLSEVWKPQPDAGVMEWFSESLEDDLFLSALTLGELTKGLDRLPAGKKRDRLVGDYRALRSRFSARILPVTDGVAERWGALTASAERAGKKVHVVDGLVAATALVAGLTVVTRNVADFAPTQVPLVNPFRGRRSAGPGPSRPSRSA
jgi:predicted nucleic acid-binding protein